MQGVIGGKEQDLTIHPVADWLATYTPLSSRVWREPSVGGLQSALLSHSGGRGDGKLPFSPPIQKRLAVFYVTDHQGNHSTFLC